MSDANLANFSARLREIEAKHNRRESGYVKLEERNGLLVPVEGVKLRRGAPLRGITYTLAMFLLFKGFLLAYLGEGTYGGRVDALSSGSIVEQFGGWIMHADPVTRLIADLMTGLF